MAKGGARVRSGPSQDPNALRRSGDPGVQVELHLPHAGRRGRTPAWPLSKASARERELWMRLWKMPQAVAWEQLRVNDQVALYVRRLVIAEQPDAPAAAATLVRQLQDSLGLSAPGLRSLRWEIDTVLGKIEVEPSPAEKATRGSSLKDRLHIVKPDEHAG